MGQALVEDCIELWCNLVYREVAFQAQYLLRFLLSLTTAHMAIFIHILAHFDLMSRRDSRSRLLAGVFQVQNKGKP